MQLRVKGMTLAKNDRRWTEFLIERDTAREWRVLASFKSTEEVCTFLDERPDENSLQLKASKMDDPEPHSVRDRIGAAGGVELIDEGVDMELGSVNRDPEPAGDGLIGGALGQKRDDLQLARRQPDVGVYWSRVLRQDQSDVGLLAWSGQPHTGKVCKHGGQLIRKIGVVDLDRNHDHWRSVFFFQVSDLSPICRFTSIASPARFKPRRIVSPTLSGPSARSSARTL